MSDKRPVTAASVIEKLKIEKANSGEGLTFCGGIFLAANCYIFLFVMSGIFYVIGSILTAISWRPRDFGEEMQRFLIRQEWSSDIKILGPVFLLIGLLMMMFGLTLCVISKKMKKEDFSMGDQQSFHSYFNNSEPPDPARSITSRSQLIRDNFMPTISSALPMGVFAQEPSMPLLLPFKTWTAALTSEKIQLHQRQRGYSLHPELLQLRNSSRECEEALTNTTANSFQERRRSLPVIDSLVYAAEHGNNLGKMYRKRVQRQSKDLGVEEGAFFHQTNKIYPVLESHHDHFETQKSLSKPRYKPFRDPCFPFFSFCLVFV